MLDEEQRGDARNRLKLMRVQLLVAAVLGLISTLIGIIFLFLFVIDDEPRKVAMTFTVLGVLMIVLSSLGTFFITRLSRQAAGDG